ncbi:MAG TPA: DUF1566 domain-containing protein [Desulfuromonadales bacterium]|nr:DUF1566 domain-containing protein [Desulfuromonadales bacterium]
MLKRVSKIMVMVAVAIVAHGAPYGAEASTIQLPRSGQTGCWNTATNASTPCSTTSGQDGNILAGKPWPTPRFTDNGNGSVTDNLTGLIWLKNAGCFDTVGGIAKGTSAATSQLTWPNALTWSNSLKGDNSACSLNDGSVAGDWRLPNIAELESLIDLQNANPALPTGHPFSVVQSNWYWSSSTYVNSTDSAWIVSMDGGGSDGGNKGNNIYVWPVRAGQ